MLLIADSQHAPNPHAAPIPSRSQAARMLAQGTLGTRLLASARLAAALHMAQSAGPRNEGAQNPPSGAAR